MVYAYIPNEGSNSVSVINTATLAVSTISTGIGNNPNGTVVSPVLPKVYVTNSTDGTVSVINTSTNTVISGGNYPITVGTDPLGAAISPNGALVFISNDGSGSVSVINTATDTVIKTITVGTNPNGMAVSPDGTTLYVANAGSTSVSVITISTLAVSSTVTTGIGTGPCAVAVSPDGSTLYVVNDTGGTVSVLKTATLTPVTGSPVTVGTAPNSVAVTPDGTKAFVTNTVSRSVSVIDASTLAVTNVSIGGATTEPYSVSITPDGTQAYITNAITSGSVYIISTTSPYSNISGSPITLGSNPTGWGQFLPTRSISMTTLYAAPQGRLTLTSNAPVMTADATAQTSVYYTPYQGNIVPIYDGANMTSYAFGQLTMTLNTSNQTSGNIYDLFIFLNSSVVTIGAGPAWSSTTSRGTGSGTTQLQQTDGLWVNANTITLKNGSTSYTSIPVGEATYAGSIYMTANGQTGMSLRPAAASGGGNCVMGIWNAYNRVLMTALSMDSTASWTYNSTTPRAANGNNNNRVTWVDGLQQSFIKATYVVPAYGSSVNNEVIGLGLDSTSAFSGAIGSTDDVTNVADIIGRASFYPQLGLHFIQALESVSGTPETSTYFGQIGSTQAQSLSVELEA